MTEFRKITFMGLLFIYGSNTVQILRITRKNVELHKICFCDIRKTGKPKILIVSGMPIRVIFQNSVTYLKGQCDDRSRLRIVMISQAVKSQQSV